MRKRNKMIALEIQGSLDGYKIIDSSDNSLVMEMKLGEDLKEAFTPKDRHGIAIAMITAMVKEIKRINPCNCPKCSEKNKEAVNR